MYHAWGVQQLAAIDFFKEVSLDFNQPGFGCTPSYTHMHVS